MVDIVCQYDTIILRICYPRKVFMKISATLLKNTEMLRAFANKEQILVNSYVLKKIKDEYGEIETEKAFYRYKDLMYKYGMYHLIDDSHDFEIIYNSFSETFEYEELFMIAQYAPELNVICDEVIDLYTKLMKDNVASVLIAEAESFTKRIKDIIKSHSNCNFVLTSTNILNYDILQSIFKGYNNVSIKNENIYEYNFINEKFDLIFSIPAFGGKVPYNKLQNFICREYDSIALENLLLHLNQDGKLGIVLPARITFAGGATEKLRNFIQSMYKIEEISELPPGIFKNTAIKTYFLTIATGQTDDISIKRYCWEGNTNKFISNDDTFIMSSELEAIGDWNVDKIFAMQDDDWKKYQNSDLKKIKLGDVATSFRGKVITQKENVGSIGVIGISNINNISIDYTNIDFIEEDFRKVNNYILNDGDLLLSARGTTIKTAVFKKQAYPCIASSNLIVVRPKETKLIATYLKIFLDSPIGVKLIKSIQQGTNLVNISYKDLINIEIPILPIEEQKVISEEYEKELSLYQNTINAANDRWQNVIRELQNKF